MRTPLYAKLLLLGLLASPMALTGCVEETEVETEPGEAPEVDVDLEPDMDAAEQELEEAGDAIEGAAEDAGDAIVDAANDAEDAVDENIDLGDNAGTPEVDDDN